LRRSSSISATSAVSVPAAPMTKPIWGIVDSVPRHADLAGACELLDLVQLVGGQQVALGAVDSSLCGIA